MKKENKDIVDVMVDISETLKEVKDILKEIMIDRKMNK